MDMQIELLGIVRSTREIVMINIDTLQIVRIPYETVKRTLETGKKIIGIQLSSGKMQMAKVNLTEYEDGNTNNDMYIGYVNLTALNRKLILRQIYKVDGKVSAYRFITNTGVQKDVEASKVLSCVSEYNNLIMNGELLKSGEFKSKYTVDVQECNTESPKKETMIDRSYLSGLKKTVRRLPQSQSRLSEIDPKSGFTLLEKITSAMMAIYGTKPYYYTALTSLNRVESYDIETAGVTIDTLYMNPDFMLEIEQPELIFVLLHEIGHIVMMHNSRRMNREPELWNVACDLYVNKFIAEEIGIDMVGGKVTLKSRRGNSVVVKMPSRILFNENVDINNDTPESIYTEMIKSQQKNQQTGNGQDQQGQKVRASINRNKYTFRGGEYSTTKVEVDIIDDDKSSKMSDQQKKQAQQNMNRRIRQKAKQDGVSSGRGTEAGGLEGELEKALVEKIDWKKVFRNMLAKSFEEVTSFASPDRRFIGRGKVLPGKLRYETEGITHVRVFIDTSGSIDNKQLYIALKQAQDLMKTYKATAKVSFWDTEVYGEQEFSEPKDIMKAKPIGRGGTEINSVFRYMEDIEKKDRANTDITDIIMIWTDGFFGTAEDKYEKRYGKRTVFVVSEDQNKGFEAPFGKKAYFKN